jgi:transcriptional regulator with XRE-family HTH domain
MPPKRAVFLVNVRRRRGLTQSQLAERSGIRQGTISKLERNPNARPEFETVKALARELDVEPTALRFGPSSSKGIAA